MTGKKNQSERKSSENQQNSPQSPFSSGWIASESLLTVFASLWVRRKESVGQLDGSHLAQALQRLVHAEKAPGGPYVDTGGVVDPLANAAIALFLREEGVILPSLKPFLAQFEPEDIEERMRIAAARYPKAVRGTDGTADLTEGRETLLARIDAQVHTDMAAWLEPLAATGEQVFLALQRADHTAEIRLMPHLFASSLATPPEMNTDQFVLLGAANVFFWIGGMLFDDFLDEEGKPELLPIATMSHRRTLALYRQATVRCPEFYAYIEASCALADRANAWEVTYARAARTRRTITISELPDYSDNRVLADRSVGHLFGPLLIVHQLPSITVAQSEQIEQGLRHYLVARQLNDDIHDWREDLLAGQLSRVVVELLRGAGVGPGNHRFAALVPRLEQYFMSEGLRRVCGQVQDHVTLARESLAASRVITPGGGLGVLIDRQASIVQASLETDSKYQRFLATFSKDH